MTDQKAFDRTDGSFRSNDRLLTSWSPWAKICSLHLKDGHSLLTSMFYRDSSLENWLRLKSMSH